MNKNHPKVSQICIFGIFSKGLDLESLGKNPKDADLGYFRVIFIHILKMVYCVNSLELPQ